MIPEEKANYLIKIFYKGVREDGFVTYRETRSKTLALICVDEIIRIQNHYDERGEEIRYWLKVKQIINEKKLQHHDS